MALFFEIAFFRVQLMENIISRAASAKLQFACCEITIFRDEHRLEIPILGFPNAPFGDFCELALAPYRVCVDCLENVF